MKWGQHLIDGSGVAGPAGTGAVDDQRNGTSEMPEFNFRSPRLFVDAALAAGRTVELERGQSNYLGNVLRLAAGETILVFNGRDGEWQALIDGRKRPDRLNIQSRTRPHDHPQ